MSERPIDLSTAKKAVLAVAGLVVMAIPVMIGVMNALALQVQAQAIPKFEVASIKLCAPGGRGGYSGPSPGRVTVNCSTMMSSSASPT